MSKKSVSLSALAIAVAIALSILIYLSQQPGLGVVLGLSADAILSRVRDVALPRLPEFWQASLLLGVGLLLALWAMRASAVRQLPNAPAGGATTRTELGRALKSYRSAFAWIALFSGILNVLMLTGSLYMLEVYDRVLPSGSVPTLIGLSVITGVLFVCQGLLDVIRSRLLTRIGLGLDEAMSTRVFALIGQLSLRQGMNGDGSQPVRDLEVVRSFLSSLGPTALFDLPWIPLYLLVLFGFHPILGLAALAGALVLVVITVLAEVLTRDGVRQASTNATVRHRLSEASLRNAEVVAAMGMAKAMNRRWTEASQDFLASQRRVSDISGGLSTVAKIGRIMLQSAMLGIGAYLAVNGELTPGVIIASSILSSRALAPIDLAIANWKGFVAARQSWHRLNGVLASLPVTSSPMPLPTPKSELRVESMTGRVPGDTRAIIEGISFQLTSGQGLGVIGPSGSGKSSLARLLVGIWQPFGGKVRIDGAALEQWPQDTLGRHIGYLPQSVELFSGTIAQNISRFEADPDPNDIVEAAEAAGVHELVLRMPHGYATPLGQGGAGLSAGQAQRIALARALFGRPFLLVLDEPNSNLDSEGDAALTKAILAARERGAIVVVIAHRPSALSSVDMVMILQDGRMRAVGRKDEVMAAHLRPAAAVSTLKVVPDAGRPQ